MQKYHWYCYLNGEKQTTCEMKGGRNSAQRWRAKQVKAKFLGEGVYSFSKILTGSCY